MGSFCPCFSRTRLDKTKKVSYDVEAFQISESISDLSTVKQGGFQAFHEQQQEETDRKETEETSIKASQQHLQTQTQSKIRINQSQEYKTRMQETRPVQPLLEIPQQQKVQVPAPQPPAKKPNRYHKNVNLDDYRFVNLASELKVKKLNTLNQQQFNINSCKDCEIYIFDITANVYIDKCENCFIYCAPCESTVFVRDCTNLRIIAATKQFRVRDCHNLGVSLYCNSQPVIESSDNIEFSSFGTFGYSQLYDQFKKAKMSVFNNHWPQIHDFTKKETLNYKLTLEKEIECNWKQALEEAGLEYSSPLVPKIMDRHGEEYQLAILNSPTEEQIEGIVYTLIKEDIVVYKSFRGKLDEGVHERLRQALNNAHQNDYLCLKVSRQAAEKVSEEFEIVKDEDKYLEQAIFPAFKDEH